MGSMVPKQANHTDCGIQPTLFKGNYLMAIVKESTSVPRSDAIPLGMLAAGWLSVQDPSLSVLDVSKALIRDVLTSHQDKSLVDALQRLGALRTVRAFSRQKTAFVEPVATESSALITLRKGEVWWNDLRLGILVTIFQNIMPQEAQARLSYDTFRYRFLSWLEGHCGVLALDAEASDAMVILFVPDGVPAPDIPAEWQRFVT